jgi:hypothetical protein
MKKPLVLFCLMALSAGVAYAETAKFDGRKTVSAAGTAEAITSTVTPFTWVDICAEADNTGVIAVGPSPIADANTREGIYLEAGDCYHIEAHDKRLDYLNEWKIDTTVNGDGVTFTGALER